MVRRLAVLLAAALLGACAPAHRSLREANLDKLPQVTLGMSRADVARIMGGEYAQMTYHFPFWNLVIDNPQRSETLKGPRGDVLRVDYYYTGEDQDAPTGTTPVVYRDDRVIGVGSPFLAGQRLLEGYR